MSATLIKNSKKKKKGSVFILLKALYSERLVRGPQRFIYLLLPKRDINLTLYSPLKDLHDMEAVAMDTVAVAMDTAAVAMDTAAVAMDMAAVSMDMAVQEAT